MSGVSHRIWILGLETSYCDHSLRNVLEYNSYFFLFLISYWDSMSALNRKAMLTPPAIILCNDQIIKI